MRYVIAALLIAAPAAAETPLTERPCMEVIGPVVYGPPTYQTGLTSGVVLGYSLAEGQSEAEAQESAASVAKECKESPNMTFREALSVLDQPD